MSDFLQFVDRIPTLPNRKKLTFENDGSVKYATVEYADEPVEEGTPLSKFGFNRLNAVFGYNQTSVERVHTESEIPFDIDNLEAKKLSVTLSNNASYSSFNAEYDKILQTIQPILKISGLAGNIITSYSMNASSTNKQIMALQKNYSGSISNALLLELLNRHERSDGYSIILKMFHTSSGNQYGFQFDYDLSSIDSFDFNINCQYFDSYNKGELYSSVDGITYNKVLDITENTDNTYHFENTPYIRVIFYNSSSGNSSNINLYYMYISNATGSIIKEEEINKFTLDTNDSFVNNQRVLVETPSTTDVVGATLNTLNDIEIEAILQPLTKYKLYYNSSINKFIIDNMQTLVDITLEEDVNQVQLTGLSKQIKKDKLYIVIIIGKVSANSVVYLSDASLSAKSVIATIPSTQDITNFGMFSANINITDNTSTIQTMYHSSGDYKSDYFGFSIYDIIDMISCTGNNNFKAGTRIIIKEVA